MIKSNNSVFTTNEYRIPEIPEKTFTFTKYTEMSRCCNTAIIEPLPVPLIAGSYSAIEPFLLSVSNYSSMGRCGQKFSLSQNVRKNGGAEPHLR
jgi:hypothetical protein